MMMQNVGLSRLIKWGDIVSGTSDHFGYSEKKYEGVIPRGIIDENLFLKRMGLVVLTLALIYLAVYFLKEFAAILQPFFIAVFICYLIIPIHHWLTERKIPSTVAFVVILMLVIGAFYGIGSIVYDNIKQVYGNWEAYRSGFLRFAQNVDNFIARMIPFVKPHDVQEALKLPSPQAVSQKVNAFVGTFLNFFTGLLVILVYLIFFIAERRTFQTRLKRAFGDHQSAQVLGVIQAINQGITQYLGVKTLISLITGLVTMIVLMIFGVDFVVTWGILTFLFNFVPYIGSIVAAGFPVLLCFVQYPDQLWRGFAVAGCLFAIQQVIGNYVEPKYMGSKLHVSPLLIILALAFWAAIWGIVGMVLAVPILVITQIILRNIKETKPLAEMMSDQ